MTAGLLLAIALLAPVVSRRLTGDFFSPPALAASAWCGTLGLFALRLLPYGPLQPATRILIAGTIVCLVFGSALAAWWVSRRIRPGSGATRQPQRPGAWITGYAIVGLLGFAWYVFSAFTVLGWQGIVHGYLLREALFTYRIPSTFLFAQFFTLVAPLVALAFMLGNTRVPVRVLILPGLCVVATLLSTDRTQFFMLVLTAGFMAVHRFGPELSWSRVAGGALVVAALFLFLFLAIGWWRGETAENSPLFLRLPGVVWVPGKGAMPRTDVPATLASAGRAGQRLGYLYAYVTVSYAALDGLLASPRPHAGGKYIFFPALRALQRSGLLAIDLPSQIPESILVSPPPAEGLPPLYLNQYSFLYYPLQDFGTPGALTYALVISAIFGALYAWGRGNREDPLRLLLIGQMATAVALSPLVNKFSNTAWWYILLLTTLPWVVARLRSWRAARHAGAAAPA
jgi:hypothetical protein